MKVTSCLYCGGNVLSSVTQRSDEVGILKCATCGIMMVDHISDNYEELYTADYFEKQNDTRSGYTSYLSSPVANVIGKYGFARLFAREPGRHLDLGCADGSLMEIFASEGFESRGLEISRAAIEIARTKGLDVRFSKLHGFPAGLPSSNVITAFDLLEHADKPRQVLKAVYDNLSQDGYLVFSTLSVKKEDPSDFWFNHSLEHYIYYNQENLTYALTDIFGKGKFAFTEVEVNGVAEFWGFAKKGKTTWEKKVINRVAKESFDKEGPTSAYYTTLFYNQLSKFTASRKIIEHFATTWPAATTTLARFYTAYLEGRLEQAVEGSKVNRSILPARSVYWQALSDAETKLYEIKEVDVEKAHADEVLKLRQQVFLLRGELHALKNARVLGKIIKLRDYIGDARRRASSIKLLPHSFLHAVRVVSAPYVPAPARRKLKHTYRDIRTRLQSAKDISPEAVFVANKRWRQGSPLISVVIPYYNRMDTIDDTLASLSAQTYKAFEVILVDDGSTEEASIRKLQELSWNSLKHQLIHQKNQGVANARNTGIAKARGKYIICLDSDDLLEPTYIEKCLLVLESRPDVAVVTTHQYMFGVINELFRKSPFDPARLYHDNMIITAAAFTKEAWSESGGYKSGIGYEDWEYWISLSEVGYWGKLIPEPLFKYRTAMQSRYVEDKDIHWNNIKRIHALHANYMKKVKHLITEKCRVERLSLPETAFVNLANEKLYAQSDKRSPNILITIPWMTFGGAETLIYNYCREVKDVVNISFVTGLKSENEWEYKFREITPNIYHLANLFEDQRLYVEFISNYISTRHIDVLHIIHNGFTFDMLETLKARHPGLKVIVTMFNDRVEYFAQSLHYARYINVFTTDNVKVADHYKEELGQDANVAVIPNGINCYEEFNPSLFNRIKQRDELGIQEGDVAVFFVGRLSEEKNPDVFVEAADRLLKAGIKNMQFFIIGDGPMRPDIERLIKQASSKKIHYLGYQSKIAQFMSAADVFVLPSSIEGFPLSILEAMAMHAVVVASDVGAVAQIIDNEKEGFVVEAGSVEQIALCLKQLNADRLRLVEMADLSRSKVEELYSNRILGRNYKRLYKETIK